MHPIAIDSLHVISPGDSAGYIVKVSALQSLPPSKGKQMVKKKKKYNCSYVMEWELLRRKIKQDEWTE